MAGKRLYHEVADRIVDLIDSGVFPPGSRLPGERDLAEKFDVSRVTVREAEIVLQALGRLEIKIGSGAYVLGHDEHKADGLPEVGPFELTEARAMFEADAAALAAPIISDEAIEELEFFVEVMSGKGVGVKANGITPDEADEAFHLTIAKATSNPVIVHVIRSMWDKRREVAKLKKVFSSVCDIAPQHRENEHHAILTAVKNRDSNAARSAMREHFAHMIEALHIASENEARQEVEKKTAESRSRFLMVALLD